MVKIDASSCGEVARVNDVIDTIKEELTHPLFFVFCFSIIFFLQY